MYKVAQRVLSLKKETRLIALNMHFKVAKQSGKYILIK